MDIPLKNSFSNHKKASFLSWLSVCRQKGFGMVSFRTPFSFFIEFEAIIENSRPLRDHHLGHF